MENSFTWIPDKNVILDISTVNMPKQSLPSLKNRRFKDYYHRRYRYFPYSAPYSPYYRPVLTNNNNLDLVNEIIRLRVSILLFTASNVLILLSLWKSESKNGGF